MSKREGGAPQSKFAYSGNFAKIELDLVTLSLAERCHFYELVEAVLETLSSHHDQRRFSEGSLGELTTEIVKGLEAISMDQIKSIEEDRPNEPGASDYRSRLLIRFAADSMDATYVASVASKLAHEEQTLQQELEFQRLYEAEAR